jgi:hypothetical protein
VKCNSFSRHTSVDDIIIYKILFIKQPQKNPESKSWIQVHRFVLCVTATGQTFDMIAYYNKFGVSNLLNLI